MSSYVVAMKMASDHFARLMDEAQRERIAREARNVPKSTAKRRKHFRPMLRPVFAHR